MSELKKITGCDCKKIHDPLLKEYIAEKNAISKLGDFVKKYGGKKVFVLADVNTYKAAGISACDILEKNGIEYSKYIFNQKNLEPDEYSVGSAVMHFDHSCDIVVGVGSGVINDIGKILSRMKNVPYIIVATAPSMDGYASATSSMSMDGLKVSLPSKCADVVIGDIDILKNAPAKMLVSGLGDMLAKYVSICEWRISNLITGEYYCESIAQLIRDALKKCVDNKDKLLKRDEEAVKAVFEGLVIGGVAMNYAGLSRPASGVEHYFSHVWDMRGLEFGTNVDLHGIQCAIGTLYGAHVYDKIRKITPDKEKALCYANKFDYKNYSKELIKFLGKGADAMIALEEKEKKYDVEKHAERLDIIIEKWDEIIRIIDEEIPSADEIKKILSSINAPQKTSEIGICEDIIPMTFKATKDIRDKYVVSRLCWDLGIIDEIDF